MADIVSVKTCPITDHGVARAEVVNGVLIIHRDDGSTVQVTLPDEKGVTDILLRGRDLWLMGENGNLLNIVSLPADDRGGVNLTVDNGGIALLNDAGQVMSTVSIDPLLPPDDKGVVSGVLRGSSLVLLGEGGNEMATVSLASLIPAVQADRFLKSVSYDNATAELVFTTGEGGNTNADTVFRVSVSDLQPVSTSGTHITGNGTGVTPIALNLQALPGDATLRVHNNGLVVDTGNLRVATQAVTGIVRLATNQETTAGTSSSVAVTPAGLKAALDARADDRGGVSLNLSGTDLSLRDASGVTLSTADLSGLAGTTVPAATVNVAGTVKLGDRLVNTDGTVVLGYLVQPA